MSVPVLDSENADLSAPQNAFILEALAIRREYPGVVALDGVDLRVRAGEAHALVGENGAGKSTLIKILAGALRPTSGELIFNKSQVAISHPSQARQLGIAVVHQHHHLIPDLTIAENYALRNGYDKSAMRTIQWGKVSAAATRALAGLVPNLDVNQLTCSLTGVEKQLVELAFGFAEEPKLLVLDEPTAVLPYEESERLFVLIEAFVERGGALLYVSHRLGEVSRLCDQVTVLRDGKLVWSKPIHELDTDAVIRGMVGRDVSFSRDETLQAGTETALELQGYADSEHAFKNVSLTINRGEIYGLYGLVGAGQHELCTALLGLRDATGTVRISPDVDLTGLTPAQRVDRGVALVPAERLDRGILKQMTVGENMSLASLPEKSTAGWVRGGPEWSANQDSIKSLQIKTTGQHQFASQLSGGNQQKVLLGRWLQTSPSILILEEPSQGVDVGAKMEIHRLIREEARKGTAVLLATSELPELLSLSHRIGVMREGELVHELPGSGANEEQILRLALPEHEEHTATAATAEVQKRSGIRWRELGLFAFLIAVVLAASLWVPGFATVRNFRDIIVDQSILVIGALGMAAIIIAGGIDVSAGAIMGLAALSAALADRYKLPVILISIIPILVGTTLGALNGLLSVLGRVHSIVITLGALFILRGVMVKAMDGRTIDNLSDSTKVFGQANWGSMNVGGEVLGIPFLPWAALLSLLAGFAFLRYTEAGRKVYALGGDGPSAILLGVRPVRTFTLAFAFGGALAGLAGLLYAGRYGVVQTNVGQGIELKFIAAAVIGGVSIMGGRGSVFGVVLGALLLGVVSNLLVLLKISSHWEHAVIGSMILLAVCADAFAGRRGKGVA